MIGFDRPLRPRWIYDSLLLAEPGQKLTELNKPFESIAKELTGKEGKRKARTVLFRCFLRDETNRARVRKELYLKDISYQYELDFLVPIYLFYLVGNTNVLFRISEYIFRLYDYNGPINPTFLRDKIVDMHGDRDVVARSVRSFLKTLEYFGVVQNKGKNLVIENPIKIDDEQLRIMLDLYSKDILNTPQISLNDLPGPIFNYFELPDLKDVARKFSGHYWEYQHRVGSDFIMLY